MVSNETVVGENGESRRFSTSKSFISETIDDRHIVTMED